ncbi:MAG TPA: hypothetical protein DCQ31_16025, partial [Bacteroidales bacterium]|nr:hypothetical protein [Bacteroidales bacterium]
RFEVLGTQCYTCHQTEYQTATAPDHKAANYGTNCEDCHNVFSREWKATGFNHGFFPLSRGHAITDCKECHKVENEKLNPACITCHTDDFNKAADPNHVSLNFPNECQYCHTTSPGWDTKSNLNHDIKYFPIYVGIHGGKWDNCIDCHNNQSDFKDASCLGCHEHNQADMDDEHNGKRDYAYLSSACLNCHPKGRK